ncbi:putative glutamine amidotransferase [Heterostelium album PN500]|uniref:Putative glutamine amidotransferase n=1 Tax=Heterostelium pallidum (strain ATCC 26659 / Pp 5 / PN500) TaxID=670386 RepID=D3BK47_HETP5|nr:putative glutamine amidotransferase [Heterostelium album PN500]EFA78277.1 putative glutamine amidotransferase [Heterostelium album PN500]|eukprot:XP_020430402.1 putative glutamine amidotransferase [Heterostelium album PN500]
MCRFIHYLGPPIKISSIVTEPSHGLVQQSLHSTCPGVHLNADGFGIAWFVPEISPNPAVFKDITPAWSNINLRQLARVTKSGCIMSHVRAASAGAITTNNCHPFTYKNLSWMHNGTVSYFPKLKLKFYNMLSQSALESIKGTTDSECIFALFITNYEKEIGFCAKPKPHLSRPVYSTHCLLEPEDEPFPYTDNAVVFPKVMQKTISQIHQLILDYEVENGIISANDEGASLQTTSTHSKLNLVVSDGYAVVATRYVTGTADGAHTLYWSRAKSIVCDKGACTLGSSKGGCDLYSLIISSEPLASDFTCEEVPINNMTPQKVFIRCNNNNNNNKILNGDIKSST